jgi:hypothetical protein
VRFGASTIERWYSAEHIVRRSRTAGATKELLPINRISAARTLVWSA